ncbi:aminotransferase class V-fold PLP-dependent enzyme, partial [bacterium]
AVAREVGVPATRVALVENATSAVNTVLGSIELEPGDEVLSTDHTYNAVRLTIEAFCRRHGATPRVVELPVPTTAGEVEARLLEAVGPRTRLAVLDHLTSPSALRLPLERLVPALQARGVRVLVDGAHALGQIGLDLGALGADWYATNAHKWLYAPRGVAALICGEGASRPLAPLVISHGVARGFPDAFDYVGTRDYTAWLSLPAAAGFHGKLRQAGLDAYCASLVDAGSVALEQVGAVATGTRDLAAWMRAWWLPQDRAATAEDAASVMQGLWERERIQIRCAVLGGKLLLRFCAQAYVEKDELVALGDALGRQGWPARSAARSRR